MAEENKTETPAAAVSETEEKSGEPAVEIIEPSLADDILKLEQLNILRSVTLRMQGGRHPKPDIEALLQRRLNIPRESFQGPYAIRLVCTLMMIFVVSVIFWGLLWALGSMLNLSCFLRLTSTGIATLFAAVAGIAVFFPSSIPEEKALIAAIEEQMNELRSELGKKQPETTKPPDTTNNTTNDAVSEDTAERESGNDTGSETSTATPSTAEPSATPEKTVKP